MRKKITGILSGICLLCFHQSYAVDNSSSDIASTQLSHSVSNENSVFTKLDYSDMTGATSSVYNTSELMLKHNRIVKTKTRHHKKLFNGLPQERNSLQEGRWFVGGKVQVAQKSSDNVDLMGLIDIDKKSSYTYRVDVFGGYNFRRNWQFGTAFGYKQKGSDFSYVSDAETGAINRTQDIRRDYYFDPFMKNFLPILNSDWIYLMTYSHVQLGFGEELKRTTSAEDEISVENSHVFSFSVGVNPGMAFFINKYVSVEATVGMLGFSSETKLIETDYQEDDKGHTTSNDFSFKVDILELNLSIVYYIQKPKVLGKGRKELYGLK